MNLKTYRAFSMAEALAAVKQHLGHDAIILNTRSFRRGGLFGLGGKTIIEVTATPAEKPANAPLLDRANWRTTDSHMKNAVARRAYSATTGKAIDLKPSTRQLSDAIPTSHDKERTRRLAQAMEEVHNRMPSESRPDSGLTPLAQPPAQPPAQTPAQTPAKPEIAPPENKPPQLIPAITDARKSNPNVIKTQGKPQRFILTPVKEVSAAAKIVSSKDDDPASSVMHDRTVSATSDDSETMQEELAAIRQLVGQVLKHQTQATGFPQSGMPQILFDQYLKLISQDLSEELSEQVINRVRKDLTVPDLEDVEKVREKTLEYLAAFIPTLDHPLPEESPDGRPLTIALIGPTGVGKTTTLAKIAASCKLRQGKSVGLITADTYRIAAVDQLRTYANIIGLPLEVALTPTDMKQAVHALSGCDVILIDTAGRSQNDGGRLKELARFIEAADPHEVHLVLSSTASEKVLLNEAEAFSEVGVDKLVLTKLDEAVSFGVLVNVLRKVGKNLSFITTGQEVPDHIECGRSTRLAQLVMGETVHP